MAFSYIQTIDFGNTGSASSIVTGSYTLTAGSRVIACACYASGSDLVTTISDTNGNTWAKVGTGAAAGGTGMYFNLFECKSVTSAGSTQITVNLSGSTSQRGIAGMEVSSLDSSAAIQDYQHQYQANPGTATDAITTGLMTPTSQPAMVFGFYQDIGNSDVGDAGTGFTKYACPNCSVVNANSNTFVQQKRVTATDDVASTATSSAGATHFYMSYGAIIGEPAITGTPGRLLMLGVG